MDFFIGIPTYKRGSNLKTIDYLRWIGFPMSRVFISTQRQEDYEACRREHGGKIGGILHREGTGVSFNRNTILDNFEEGAFIVQMDDDFKSVVMLGGGGNTLIKAESVAMLEHVVKSGFSTACALGGKFWGLYPVSNAYFMKRKTRRRALNIGTFIGIRNTDIRFDERLRLKEDLDFSCQHIRRFGFSGRLEWASSDAAHKSKGGCQDDWESRQEECFRLIMGKHGDLLKANPKRRNEVLLKEMEDA